MAFFVIFIFVLLAKRSKYHPDMQTPHLSAKFAVFNMKWVTYVIRADPQRKYLGGGGQSVINYQPQSHRCRGGALFTERKRKNLHCSMNSIYLQRCSFNDVCSSSLEGGSSLASRS